MKNCADLPTYTHGLLNDIMTSASNDDFTGYMRTIYYEQKCSKQGFDFLKYLKVAEAEHRTLYHARKWTTSSHALMTTAAGFYGENSTKRDNVDSSGYGGEYGQQGGYH